MIIKEWIMSKWLLQNNIWQEYDYNRFVDSIRNAGIDFSMVDLIPFTENFVQDVDFIPDMVFGSNRFVEVCRSYGMKTFKSFDPIELFYPEEYWLNGEGSDMKIKDLKNLLTSGDIFIKPYREKLFTGTVISTCLDLDKIQFATSFVDDLEDEKIRVSSAVKLYQEARFYIIGGVPISASVYRDRGQAKQFELPPESGAWTKCKEILKHGSIDDAFVMDLGLTNKVNKPENWKIVELNNINSTGLYKTNTDAIVSALKNL